MRFVRKSSHRLGYLLAAVALFGLAGPAHAVPQLFTFAGPITFNQLCFGGVFAPPCEEGPTGMVTYTFLVDFTRPGERIIADASGETVTTLPGTFFAQFRGDTLPFGEVGPPEFRVRTDEHIVRGLTLHDLIDLRAEIPGCCVLETMSLRDIIGLPLSTFSIGSSFEGRQVDSIHAVGRGMSRITISALTLTEIHDVAEPGIFVMVSAGLAALAGIVCWRRVACG